MARELDRLGERTPGQRCRTVLATNPPLSDEGNWLITWFAPWIDPMFPKPAKPGQLRWFVNNPEGDPVWVKGPGAYDRGDGVISTAKSRTTRRTFNTLPTVRPRWSTRARKPRP